MLPIRGSNWGRVIALSASLALATFGPARPADAALYETPPPFCDGGAVRDYLAPLERMPKLHSPSSTGRIGFGPATLRLSPFYSLLIGEGRVGYTLSLRPRAPSIHPRWHVTTTLTRIDWRGRVVETLDRARRHVTAVSRERGAAVEFSVDGVPAPYRVTTVFRTDSGRKLGGFGFYFRLVAPVQDAQLSLNASSYRPGSTVFGRIENFGTEIVRYGVPYAIERYDGSSWVKAPESPKGPWILPLLGTGPGLTSESCDPFNIPPTMAPGQYRMVKSAEFETGLLLHKRRTPVDLTAEFTISP